MADTNISNLVGLTAHGLRIAKFTEIYESVCDMFRNVYGSDIDLSTGTEDGVYVWQYSLILNNLFQSLGTLYSNLDVNTAQGQYLDKLCALSNVYRQGATYSTATLTITYINNDGLTLELPNVDVSFLDKNGIEWTYGMFNPAITLEANTPQSIIVTCSQIGKIEAPVGWITKTTTNTYNIEVIQEDAANVGTNEESDEELKARRSSSTGSLGVSVLESLTGTLLEYSAIKDVKVYNNDSDTTIISKDGTSISSHNQYIIIRRLQNISISDNVVGKNIYEKLTPGIHTTATNCASTNGESHFYIYYQEILGQEVDPEVVQNVYWKEAVAIHPTIIITIQPLDNFASANNSTCESIAENVIDYMSSLQLSEDPIIREIENEVYYTDPLFRGRSTYNIVDVSIADTTNYDTYYNYTTSTYNQDSNGNWVITIE